MANSDTAIFRIPHEILLKICHNSTLPDLLRISQSAKGFVSVARESARKRVDERVRDYVDDSHWFRCLMEEVSALVIGDIALEVVLANEDVVPLASPILVIAVAMGGARRMRQEFIARGYRRVPSREDDEANGPEAAIDIGGKSNREHTETRH